LRFCATGFFVGVIESPVEVKGNLLRSGIYRQPDHCPGGKPLNTFSLCCIRKIMMSGQVATFSFLNFKEIIRMSRDRFLEISIIKSASIPAPPYFSFGTE